MVPKSPCGQVGPGGERRIRQKVRIIDKVALRQNARSGSASCPRSVSRISNSESVPLAPPATARRLSNLKF
jgi:hypothetical protein